MKWKVVISLTLACTLVGCQPRAPQTPQETGEMPYGRWGFAFFTPKALPALVTRVMIIDVKQVVSSFRTLDSTQTPTGIDFYGKTAWYKTLLFGLAPEGKVRIWLQNSAGGDNVPLQPKKITTLSDEQLDACKGINQHPNGYVYYGDTPGVYQR